MTARPTRRIPAPATACAAVIVALAALAGGCSITRPAPVKQAFLVAASAPPVAAKARPDTLRVGTVNVAAPYRGRALVYRQSEQKFEADFYNEFLVAPAAMFGEGTARALDAARVFARVVPPGAPPDGEYVLDGFVDALYADVRTPGRPAAELSITYYLSRADAPAPVPFWSKRYARRVEAAGPEPQAHVAALSTAFSEIAAELARDLAAVAPPGP